MMDWIKVTDKDPEYNQFVLVYYKGAYKNTPIVACYKGKGNWLGLDSEVWLTTEDHITHWMTLPNPPKD